MERKRGGAPRSESWYSDHPAACQCANCRRARRHAVANKGWAAHGLAQSRQAFKSHRARLRRRRIARRVVLLMSVLAIALVWWPVDNYGEGALWGVKANVDEHVRDKIVALVDDLRQQQEEAAQRRSEETARTDQEFRDAIAAHIVRLTNERRTAAKYGRLRHDPAISVIAQAHSENMLRREALEHELDGRDSNDRARDAGYDCRRNLGGGRYEFGLSENISYKLGYPRNAAEVAAEIIDGWMNSPGHRRNIMDRDATRIGVGVAISGRTLYATQNFSSCL